jgi:hypothetical protein
MDYCYEGIATVKGYQGETMSTLMTLHGGNLSAITTRKPWDRQTIFGIAQRVVLRALVLGPSCALSRRTLLCAMRPAEGATPPQKDERSGALDARSLGPGRSE